MRDPVEPTLGLLLLLPPPPLLRLTASCCCAAPCPRRCRRKLLIDGLRTALEAQEQDPTEREVALLAPYLPLTHALPTSQAGWLASQAR